MYDHNEQDEAASAVLIGTAQVLLNLSVWFGSAIAGASLAVVYIAFHVLGGADVVPEHLLLFSLVLGPVAAILSIWALVMRVAL